MNFLFNIYNKIQNLSETKRKFILWIIVIILAGILSFWWVKTAQKRIKELRKEETIRKLNLPNFEQEKKSISDLKKDIKELKDLLKQSIATTATNTMLKPEK